MALSIDVTLPRSQTPVFPDRCVACGFPFPEGFIRVGTNSIGWWTILLWTHGTRFSVEVPACETCRRKMIRQRWGRLTVGGIFVAVGVGVAVYVLGSSLRKPFRRWVGLGVALLCMLPWFVWELVFPRPIDLTAFAHSVNYEFRDEDYAEEFAELNT
jgi:hypothetical protein